MDFCISRKIICLHILMCSDAFLLCSRGRADSVRDAISVSRIFRELFSLISPPTSNGDHCRACWHTVAIFHADIEAVWIARMSARSNPNATIVPHGAGRARTGRDVLARRRSAGFVHVTGQMPTYPGEPERRWRTDRTADPSGDESICSPCSTASASVGPTSCASVPISRTSTRTTPHSIASTRATSRPIDCPPAPA